MRTFKKKTSEEAPVELKVGQIWVIEDDCSSSEVHTTAIIRDISDGWVWYRFVHMQGDDYCMLGFANFIKKEDMFRSCFSSLLDQTDIV